jgi:hypothetical protein
MPMDTNPNAYGYGPSGPRQSGGTTNFYGPNGQYLGNSMQMPMDTNPNAYGYGPRRGTGRVD